MSFDQGEEGSLYLAEEIQCEDTFKRTIVVNDRATMLNLMRGINGFTLCSGIICEELNGSEYKAIPYQSAQNEDTFMEIGYITLKNAILSEVARDYIRHLEDYFTRL